MTTEFAATPNYLLHVYTLKKFCSVLVNLIKICNLIFSAFFPEVSIYRNRNTVFLDTAYQKQLFINQVLDPKKQLTTWHFSSLPVELDWHECYKNSLFWLWTGTDGKLQWKACFQYHLLFHQAKKRQRRLELKLTSKLYYIGMLKGTNT